MTPTSGNRHLISGAMYPSLRGRRLNNSTALETVGVLNPRSASSCSLEISILFSTGFVFSRPVPTDHLKEVQLSSGLVLCYIPAPCFSQSRQFVNLGDAGTLIQTEVWMRQKGADCENRCTGSETRGYL